MLEAKDLSIVAGDCVLHSDLNFCWSSGEIVAVLGPNGVGKSTLLSTLAGVTPFPKGQIFIDGTPLSRLSTLERATRISSIAQFDTADLETRVFDRIAHGLYPASQIHPLSRSGEHELVYGIAEQLDILNLLNFPLFALSGGQRKKVHIARALVNPTANVFILDEPDAGLDVESKRTLLSILSNLVGRKKLVIVSLHDHELANHFYTTQFFFT